MQGIFPLVFVVLFVSSAFFPLRAAVVAGRRRSRSTTRCRYIADGMRHPIAFSNELAPVLEGLLAAAGVAVAAIGLSILALRGRLRDA